ncbi:TauD/TfdA family dioxygenase [Sulfidibacter corallicola]|uniref:TauD/TfdA family dioxygenase n=1 Tax=Sulfidibacter corallicola TaxID=2818388 RepID=A0A8A4TSW7_SULCO|nr:TauD/TfdA family dioxygenase [Sulfidibacter corallicola]QTD52254.1 TauD/TfdA family dioxygenase [Sulfidibacter corallicola]
MKQSKSLTRGRRRKVGDDRELVRRSFIPGLEALPLVLEPAFPGLDLVRWLETHRADLDKWLHGHGAVLLRGFPGLVSGDTRVFEAVSDVLADGDLLPYVYRSTPRTRVGDRHLYTSTEYPADQEIPLHNENAYASVWPLRIWFFAAVTADRGGATPIADSRAVWRAIPPEVRERFATRGVMYIRNYGEIDLPWQVAFQTEARDEVETFCRGRGIEWHWGAGDRLQTRQICQGVAQHPVTGDPVWFNQAHLFHPSALAAEVREGLCQALGSEGLPRDARYGDGSPIEDEALAAIRAAFAEASRSFPWRLGDLLILDNMLTAHGRHPFEGRRRVLVGMARPHRAPLARETATSARRTTQVSR